MPAKLSSGHRTGKDWFSFQSQRRAMPKNVTTTVHSCTSHMLLKLCSKSFKLGISSIWTKNLQMYKLGLEKAERSEIILLTLLDQRKSKGISEKASTSVSLTILKVLTGWITTNWRIFKEMGMPDYLACLLRNLHAGQETTVRTGHGTKD